MQQLTTFFGDLGALYLIAIAGYIAKRTGLFAKGADDVLTRLILYITLPALILFSMNTSYSAALVKDFAVLLLLSAYALGAACLKAYYYVKGADLSSARQGVQQGLIIFGNQGFLGYAVCQALFSTQGVMYAAVFNLLYLTLIWTYGIYLIAKDTKALSWKMIFFNPGTIATFLGFLIFCLPFELPIVISKFLQGLGSPTTPLSMFLIGSFVADLDFAKAWEIIKEKSLWYAAFFKLLLLPVLVIPFAFFGLNYVVLAVAVLLTAMPSAPTISLYSKRFGGDTAYASVSVCITTMLLPVTLPLIYWLLNLVYRLLAFL